MAGNDFVKNPNGPRPPGGGYNFLENATGGAGGSAPPDPLAAAPKKQQQGEDDTINPQSEIRDKGLLIPIPEVPPQRRDSAGVGSLGNPSKPFKLGGN